jgi:hypothetical protein
VTVYRLNARGKYALVRPRHGELHSVALPDWLWQDPRAKKIAILREMLARNRACATAD